jgi:exopolysaccharide biosynthesis predicted pyruvyltransferase EpsI
MVAGTRAAESAGSGGAEIQRLQRIASEVLRGAGGEGPFALLDFPDHANVGDSAIWLGEMAYFRDHRGAVPSYVAGIDSFSESALRARLPEGPIFIHGGGNFGDIWPRHQQFRALVLDRFRDRQIIQLPQSVHFDDPGGVDEIARAIARHRRFRLLVRDRWSYDLAASRFDCDVALCPDMAFFLGSLRPREPRVDVLYLLRTDRERVVQEQVGSSHYRFEVVDWLRESRLAVGLARWKARLREMRRGRWDRDAMRLAASDAAAWARVDRGARLLSTGRVVITDRLHAHIMCLLLGVPHAVLDNSYGKLRRFLDLWTPDLSGVYRAASLPDAEAWAAAWLARERR